MRYTIRLVTPTDVIAQKIEDVLRGKGEEGVLQSPDTDPPIREVGDAIIAQATANISGHGNNKEIRDLMARIGWAKQPIITRQTRAGLVASGHPASVRWEFGQASASGKGHSYPATQFFASAGMMVAARTPGVVFVHRATTMAEANA